MEVVGWYWQNSGDIEIDGDWSRNKIKTNHCKSHPIGQKKANELDIYDMSGNVWEWCSDWYDSKYYKNSQSNNPQGASSGSYSVNRGGGWSDSREQCRVANRGSWSSSGRNRDMGFRLALDP